MKCTLKIFKEKDLVNIIIYDNDKDVLKQFYNLVVGEKHLKYKTKYIFGLHTNIKVTQTCPTPLYGGVVYTYMYEFEDMSF